jgi:PleD family two-component response regulator
MTTPQDLYHAADSALLLSKRSGRNRVAVHSGE